MAFNPLSLIPVVGSLFSSGASAAASEYAADRNYQAVKETNELNKQLFYESYDLNKDLFDYQNSANIDFWNMQNDYNTPAQQMSRFSEAGLNPNLVYSQGNAGNATSIQSGSLSAPRTPKMESYQVPVNMYSGAINSFMDNLVKFAQIEKTEQETENLRTQNEFTGVNIENLRLKNVFQNFMNAKTSSEADLWYRKLMSEITRNEMQGANYESEINFRDYMGVGESQSRIDLNKEKKASLIAERSLIEYRKAMITQNIAESISRIAVNNSRIDLNEAQINKISSDIILASETYTGKQLENEISRILISSGFNLKGSSYNNALNIILKNLKDWTDWAGNQIDQLF